MCVAVVWFKVQMRCNHFIRNGEPCITQTIDYFMLTCVTEQMITSHSPLFTLFITTLHLIITLLLISLPQVLLLIGLILAVGSLPSVKAPWGDSLWIGAVWIDCQCCFFEDVTLVSEVVITKEMEEEEKKLMEQGERKEREMMNQVCFISQDKLLFSFFLK